MLNEFDFVRINSNEFGTPLIPTAGNFFGMEFERKLLKPD